MDKYIVVNATALDKSGAFSILRQFIENIPDDNLKWLILIPENVFLQSNRDNIRLEPILGVKPMYRRFWWDATGLNRWLKRNNVEPIACVSLQNTGFHVSKNGIPKFIYYHQPLPFYPNKWSPFRKSERTLWFYKKIYPFFVRLFLGNNTVVFTQLEFIKNGFQKKFRHSPEKIETYYPSVASIQLDGTNASKLISEEINLFYPATAHFYKNHFVLFEALQQLHGKAKLYVTIPSEEEHVTSIGVIPFEQVCDMYLKCDALVFPSYIETFGLPLLEAAQTGMPIIAADLPYAREVLDGYDGVEFVPYNDSKAWACAILKLKKGKRFKPFDISNRAGWKQLFDSIKSSL